jgi:hypothetical protein
VGNGQPVSPVRAAGWRSPRRVLGAILALWAVLILAGGAYAWFHRHDTICRDGRAPVAQHDVGIGQVEYRCHDGQLVTRP